MTVREDIKDARNEINDIKNNNDTWATIILHDYKRDKILFFVMWIITFIALVGAVFYIVHLYEDITTVETVEVEQENQSGNNNYIGNDGDING